MSLHEYAAGSGAAIADPLDAPASASPTFAQLPMAAIASSLTNPRKTFDQAKLKELATSIRMSGVHQPVLVRPLPAARLQDTYYLRDSPKAPLPTFELVAGERRLRACKLAGVDTIPAMIKAMTDREVLECQLIENLQRDDLAPMEEAEGYQALIEAHVRECAVDNIDLVCMVLLSLHYLLYLVQYKDGKASPTPHIDAVAAELEVDLQAIKDQVKELLKPKAKKPAAVASKLSTKPGAMQIQYRGPAGETWTGRGQQPAWVKAALKRGQTLEQLASADHTR